MPGISRRPYPLSARRLLREDDGFGLIEVMVSAVLVVALALATLKLLDGAQQVSSNNRSRDVAAQLAQSEQDAIRQMPITALAGGYHPGTITKQVGGILYTIDSSADWVQDSGGPVTCSTSGAVSYLATTTSVTWPGMGTIKPVTADAIVDPGVAALGASKGALTVLLSRADGTGAEGVTVTVEGMSAVTDENGCAVIGNLDVGNQTLTYSDPAFVDKDSKSAVTKLVTIGAGSISQTSALYDNPGTVNLSAVKDSAALSPMAWNGWFTLDQAQRTTPTLFTANGGSSGTKTLGLFPFSSQYKVYAGSCAGNDPSNAAYGGTAQGIQLNGGDVKSLALTMPTSRITVDTSNLNADNTKRGNATELLINSESAFASMSGCSTTAMQYWSNTSGTDSSYTIQVPYGVWRACVNYQYSDGKWRQAKTSTATGASVTNNPVVATPSTATGTYVTDLNTSIKVPAYSSTGGSSTPSNAC